MNFTFDGNLTRDVLENYLSRAATASGLIDSDTLEDDLRVIGRLGIKFLGRASGIWYMTEDDDQHFERSKRLAERVHLQDPEIIMQSCVFEIVVQRMEEVPIPPYVFEAFGKAPEKRCFRWRDAVMEGFVDEREERDPGKRGGMPDLMRDEARMWFYYRATRYIDCGYEALHMGQVHLYTAHDRGMKKTYELFDMIRAYAARHARRHKVLLDAHTHGVSVNGKLLFDYHAMPYTRFALPQLDGQKLVLVREGFSEGGDNPNGFSGQVMPYLMEYDNWGGRVVGENENLTREELARRDWWGYDQIGWFANQMQADRDRFIEYTYRWTQINNRHAYFEIPLRRMLSDAAVCMHRADSGKEEMQTSYQLNRASKKCPMGFGQEDAVAACWADGNRLRDTFANPEHLIRYGARDEYDPETGMKLPEKVVVYGSFQPMVGAAMYDSNSEITRMYYIGDNTYTLSVVIPFAGKYDYGISTYGTLSQVYTVDRYPRSGSGPKAYFETKRDNTVVRFRYRFMDHIVSVDMAE
ncbi:MAG: hypothetical protein IJ083_03420 [Clostridia bacterium]|nr:hypothetical protein [Clostridia bacterium]